MEIEEKRLSIREWAEDDRPREKMLHKGVQSLSDAELLAILIGSGSRDESAVELSRRILLASHNNINLLAQLSISDLCKSFKGIGEAKAITIIAALEFGKRRKMSEIHEYKQVKSSEDLLEVFEPYMIDINHEEFWIAILNSANRVLGVYKLTQGGTNQTVVDLPMLLKLSLEKSAHSIAVGHNHPSGQVQPSNEDNNITNRIKEGCKAIGIRLIDHIIVARGKYYSFADEGKI